MKVLAIVLLCAFAAVQGRSAGVSNTNALAVLGQNPSFIHLRIAVSTSGALETGAASLIAANWALTTADNVKIARFIWLRYGAVNVIKPTLVTESSSGFLVHKTANVAVIPINRIVKFGPNIAPISLVGGERVDTYNFCAFGGSKDKRPGEQLRCFKVSVEESESGKLIASSEDGAANRFDHGAPLINGGVQQAILVATDDSNAGTFLPTAELVPWIEEVTNLVLSPKEESSEEESSAEESSEEESSKEESPEEEPSEEESPEEESPEEEAPEEEVSEEEGLRVKFVN